MSYEDLINTILADYKIYSFTQCMDRPRSIERPLFQYKETDYEFLKRVASYLGLQLNCDTINPDNVFYFGTPESKYYKLEEDIDYKASIDIKKYRQSSASTADIHPTDFFYYIIKSKKVMHIGSTVNFKGKELYVNSYEAEYIRGELVFTYKLCRKKGIWQEKLYNEKLKGISLEGEVLEVSGEQVKLHLNIDESQDQSKAAWFRYAPPTGNIMYSMPIVGTSANLYFPNERNEEPIVIGCVRKNGSSSEKFSNVNNRYFATESGNNLDLLPGAINFTRPGLSATFNDGGGINLNSSSTLSLSAGYVGLFAGDITIHGESKVIAEKGGSFISLEGEFFNDAGIVMENGSDRASNSNFTDDDPQNGVAEAKAALEAQMNIAALAEANQGANPVLGDITSVNDPLNLYSNKPWMNVDITSKSIKNECYITQGNGSSISVDSIPTFSSSNQYMDGDKVKMKGANGEWYMGTAQSDGYVGTGGCHKFKFVADNEQQYNKDNTLYYHKKRYGALEFADGILDEIGKYTYIEQKSSNKPYPIIESDDFKVGVDVLSGQGWLGIKANILDDNGEFCPQFKVGTKLEGKLITFPFEFKPVKVAGKEFQLDGELNLMSFTGELSFNSGSDDFEESINVAKGSVGIIGSFGEGKVDIHYKPSAESNIGTKTELKGYIGGLGIEGKKGDNSTAFSAAAGYGGGVETSIEKKDNKDK